jgi:hypothetical protein
MALSLKDPETDRLAREVAKLTGESLTEAVRNALADRLVRERLRRGQHSDGLAGMLDVWPWNAPLFPTSTPDPQTRSSGMTSTACSADGD